MPHGSTKLPSVAVETRRVAPRLKPPKAPPKARVLVWAGWAAAPTMRLVRAYPGRSAVTLAASMLLVGIVGNATLMQRGRHPAPLFADPPVQASAPRVRPPRSVVATAEPPVRGPQSSNGSAASDPVAGASPAKPTAGGDEPVRRRERSVSGVGADETPTGVATRAPDPDVLRAQHALVKLGFDIKPDGHLGAETRKALDKFASTHHLAVMGSTLTPRLLQALTAAVGKPQG